MKRISFIAFLGLVPLLLQAKVFKIQFDSQRTKSGAKVAIKDINAQLPEDWSNYKLLLSGKTQNRIKSLSELLYNHGFGLFYDKSKPPN